MYILFFLHLYFFCVKNHKNPYKSVSLEHPGVSFFIPFHLSLNTEATKPGLPTKRSHILFSPLFTLLFDWFDWFTKKNKKENIDIFFMELAQTRNNFQWKFVSIHWIHEKRIKIYISFLELKMSDSWYICKFLLKWSDEKDKTMKLKLKKEFKYYH